MSEPVENQSGMTNSHVTTSVRENAPLAVVRSRTGSPTLVTSLAVASCGMEIVAAVGLFSFGGLWLDRRLGTLPLGTLLGFLVGISLGFLSLYKTVHRLHADNEREAAPRAHPTARPPMKGSALLETEEDGKASWVDSASAETRPRTLESPEAELARARPFLDRPEEP